MKISFILFVFCFLVGCANQGSLSQLNPDSSFSQLNQESSQASSLSNTSSAADSEIYSIEIAEDYDSILEIGEQTELKYTYTGYKEPIISFSSEDKDVVTISNEGIVTAKNAGIGSIVILIKESDNTNSKIQRATFDVRLKETDN